MFHANHAVMEQMHAKIVPMDMDSINLIDVLHVLPTVQNAINQENALIVIQNFIL